LHGTTVKITEII